MMKKSTFGAMLAFLFAAAGALTAAALYLYRREKELDEYERLLFNDEYEDDGDETQRSTVSMKRFRTSRLPRNPSRRATQTKPVCDRRRLFLKNQ